MGGTQVSEALEFMGELRRTQKLWVGGGESIFNVGLRAKLAQRAAFHGAVGRGMDHGPDRLSLILYLGVQILLGGDPTTESRR